MKFTVREVFANGDECELRWPLHGNMKLDSHVKDWRNVRGVNFEIDPTTSEAVLSFTAQLGQFRKAAPAGLEQDASPGAFCGSPGAASAFGIASQRSRASCSIRSSEIVDCPADATNEFFPVPPESSRSSDPRCAARRRPNRRRCA
jgi:hypothetical protein